MVGRTKGFTLQEPKPILKKYKKLLTQLDDTSMSRFEKVKEIHKFIDDQNAIMFEKTAVCKKGCSYCCSINVDVPEVEASYIAENIGMSTKNSHIFSVPDKQYFGTLCPFLDQNNHICSIYEFRPSVCRSYFVFDDPELCKQEIGQLEVNINSSTLVSSLFFNYLISKLSKNTAIDYLHKGTRDIREWF